MEKQKQQEQFQWKEGLRDLNLSELQVILKRSEDRINSLLEVGTRIRANCITITNWVVVLLTSVFGLMCNELFSSQPANWKLLSMYIYGVICFSYILWVLANGVVLRVTTYLQGDDPVTLVTKDVLDMYHSVGEDGDQNEQRRYYLMYLICGHEETFNHINEENNRRYNCYRSAIQLSAYSFLFGMLLILLLLLI